MRRGEEGSGGTCFEFISHLVDVGFQTILLSLQLFTLLIKPVVVR